MRIEKHSNVNINLVNSDIDAMRQIIMLACDQLNNSPVFHMRGTPIPSQAGMIGGELIAVREMIEEIGFAVGHNVSLKDLSIPRNDIFPLDKNESLIKVES